MDTVPRPSECLAASSATMNREYSKLVEQLDAYLSGNLCPPHSQEELELVCNSPSQFSPFANEAVATQVSQLFPDDCSAIHEDVEILTQIDQYTINIESLRRILQVYAIVDPETGYYSGMHLVVSTILSQSPGPSEAEAYFQFYDIMMRKGLRRIFSRYIDNTFIRKLFYYVHSEFSDIADKIRDLGVPSGSKFPFHEISMKYLSSFLINCGLSRSAEISVLDRVKASPDGKGPDALVHAAMTVLKARHSAILLATSPLELYNALFGVGSSDSITCSRIANSGRRRIRYAPARALSRTLLKVSDNPDNPWNKLRGGSGAAKITRYNQINHEISLYLETMTSQKESGDESLPLFLKDCRDIDRDKNRLSETETDFSNVDVEELARILKAYSFTHPSVGYCQGMHLLCARVLSQVSQHIPETESEAYFLFEFLMEKKALKRLFLRVDGIHDQTFIDKLKLTIRYELPEVWDRAEQFGFPNFMTGVAFQYLTSFLVNCGLGNDLEDALLQKVKNCPDGKGPRVVLDAAMTMLKSRKATLLAIEDDEDLMRCFRNGYSAPDLTTLHIQHSGRRRSLFRTASNHIMGYGVPDDQNPWKQGSKPEK